MICPACSRKAMSFGHSLLTLYPQHVTCQHCGVKLTWSTKWRSVFRWSLLVTALTAALFGTLSAVAGITPLIYLGCILIAAIIFGWVFWRKSVYEAL